MSSRKARLAALVLAVGMCGTAQAISISGQGTWEATLQGRDLDGDAATVEAYYDTVLDITWLADANYAGVSMTSEEAITWAASLSVYDAVNNNTYDNWRLPKVTDDGTPGCNLAVSGTDCGYNVYTATGEMAHLFYDVLGNKAYYDTAGAGQQAGYGLTNTGPFTNFLENSYWTGTPVASNFSYTWGFDFTNGAQLPHSKFNGLWMLAVSDGDVGIAAVPEPETYAMMLAGLGLVGAMAQRRKLAEI